MSTNKEIEFNNIVNDILKNEDFIELKYELHHGISRLDHSLSVARLAFRMASNLKIKRVEDITRAALLHDFFKNSEITRNSFVNHPNVALKNAMNNFAIDEMQKNIIAAHMFPLSHVAPKNVGSWLVSLADKLVAVKEVARYKVPLAIGAAYLFFVNFCIIQR